MLYSIYILHIQYYIYITYTLPITSTDIRPQYILERENCN